MNRHATIATVIMTALLVASTTVARAQTASRPYRGYVEGGILADVDPETFGEGNDIVPAGKFAVGVTFQTPWTLRFEAAAPAWHTNTVDERYSFSGRTMMESGTERH